MTKRGEWLLKALLLLMDASLAALAFYLAYEWRLRTENPPAVNILPFRNYVGMMFIHVGAMLLSFLLARLYHLKRGTSRLDILTALIAATSVGIVITSAVTSVLYKNELDYPRLMLVYSWVLTVGLVGIGRLIHDWLEGRLRARGVTAYNTLLIGTGEVGRMILNKIRQSPTLGYKVLGFVDDAPEQNEVMGVPVLGALADLPRLIDELAVEQVIIGMPERPHQEILEIIAQCQRGKVDIKVFPDVFQIIASEISIGDLNGLPLLTVRDVALRGWKLTLKRAVDVVGSAAGLIALSPLMLFVALLIKLGSPGPVFYVQERVGLDGKPFKVLKFRTMREDAEANGPGWTVENDPRRTRLGTFLRRYSIDELPRFINVLVGEMSLVGPRPERPMYVEQFRQVVPRYMERHREKAGVTGWAQVNGLRGDTSIIERTKYDLWYIENWSIWLDIKIILRTIVHFGNDDHAY
jgi:Undecaprenyl-phosphate glucose phosphotransferase